jgi:hypothetical protein
MLEISLCVLSDEVVCKSDVRVGRPVVLTTDCTPIMVSSSLVVVEAFLQAALRFPNVPKSMVESTGTVRISLSQIWAKSIFSYMNDSSSSEPNSASLYLRPSIRV